MRYQVSQAFKVKTSQGERELLPGQVISLAGDKAEKLIAAGKIRPLDIGISKVPEDVKEAYEERVAIMQYDGGLDREESDRQAWCRTACMLTKGQRELCERVKPCPKGA